VGNVLFVLWPFNAAKSAFQVFDSDEAFAEEMKRRGSTDEVGVTQEIMLEWFMDFASKFTLKLGAFSLVFRLANLPHLSVP
jgi:hypothetical protein